MTWQTFLFIPLAGFAFGYSGLKFKQLFQMMKAHTGVAGKPAKLTDIPKRIIDTIIYVFGQKAVMQKPIIGMIHATIFWGFIIISIGTVEQFATTIYSGLSFEFIGEGPYKALVFLQDVFNVLVLLAVVGAGYRRYIVRPEGVGSSRDADIVLALTGSLMLSILMMNSFLIVAHNPFYASAMPAANMFASLFSAVGPDGAAFLAIAFKWIHMLLVLGFSMYIPTSKHLHLVAAGPNTFFRKLTREKGMKPINFEDETVTQYGAAKVTDLSWKDALDYYACTECGRCQDVCPAHNTQKPLSPKMLIVDLKANLHRNKQAILGGKLDEVTSAIDENVTEDVIWACTSCRACEVACPVFIEHTDKIYSIRRNLVMMESKFPAEAQPVFKNMETNGAPWAFAAADRDKWSEGLSVPRVTEAPDFEYLFWVGCAGSFDERNKKVARSFVSLLNKANIKYAILGNEETCTGDPARRIGNEYLFQTLAKQNVETLNRYNVKKIVTACPHCFNTLKNEYGDFGGKYEVIHHSQFISHLVKTGKLKPNKAVDETVTFHDSCYLGRWNNVYDEPRDTLNAIPSARVVEMSANHDKSMCCGAGGGRMFMEETIGKRINVTRTEQALATKASIVAASCPFCMTMLTDGVKSKDMQDKVRVMDIAELMDQTT